MADFQYQPMFPHAHPVETPYRRLEIEGVTVSEFKGRRILEIAPNVLSELAAEAMRDVSHLYRPGHLQQLVDILGDDEASGNDRFVATSLLKNAVTSASFILPSCQDTGTAIVMGRRASGSSPRATTPPPCPRASRRPTPTATCGTPSWRRSPPSRRRTPAPTCPHRSTSTARPTTAMSCSSSPRGEVPPTRRTSTRRPRRC